jgi:hypothetical protein
MNYSPRINRAKDRDARLIRQRLDEGHSYQS